VSGRRGSSDGVVFILTFLYYQVEYLNSVNTHDTQCAGSVVHEQIGPSHPNIMSLDDS